MNTDSEDDAIDDADFDRSSDGDDEIDEDILDALEGDLAAAAAAEEGTEADEDSYSDDSDGGSDDDDAYYMSQPPHQPHTELLHTATQPEALPAVSPPAKQQSPIVSPPSHTSSPVPARHRSLSPAQARRAKLFSDIRWPRSYTVEAICAIPHPVPTHCLAASACMTHLLTGSQDGYVRDYDIFAAVNGKVFLTAPQRHHCGVMEGLMKGGQIRCWWENPLEVPIPGAEDVSLSPVYSLAMHSDALWALAGSDQGNVNLYTVRHDPGRLIHIMKGHRGSVSGLALQHDEMGYFSAGWDGDAIQWDLNTGQMVRKFTAHGSQLTSIGVRPLVSHHEGHWSSPPRTTANLYPHDPGMPQSDSNFAYANPPEYQAQQAPNAQHVQPQLYPMPNAQDDDIKSETSYDPLFDEPDADGEPDADDNPPPTVLHQSNLSQPAPPPLQSSHPSVSFPTAQSTARSAVAPKGAPPVLDPLTYMTFSPDVIMTASIDGQIILWDVRVHAQGTGVGRLWMSEKTPPWCMSACWSADGAQIYAGRRNGTVEIYDVRQTGRAASGTPKILKTLRNPVSSGVVSCVVAFPDGRHLACASHDNIRLWNVAEAGEPEVSGRIKSGVQFKIIPGHHGGFISQMLVDPAARFLVTASSNRGWHGESTRTIFVHEVKHLR